MVKFLIIRFSSIGDIVLTTPIIRCIKKQVDGAEVHFLTKKSFSAVLENNPYLSKIHTLKDSLTQTINELKVEEFDYVIDLHHNLRTLLVKNKLSVISFSFPKLNVEKWLITNLKINRLPKTHIVDRYFSTLRLFDIKNDGEGLDYFIAPTGQPTLEAIPENFRNGYVGFVIGAKHNTKKLPTQSIIEIINETKLPVVVLGGKDDIAEAEIIEKATANLCFNAAGKFNLNGSAWLVKNAKVIVTNDTGLMHIAAAFKKKIISVWGNTIPEFGMYPYIHKEDSKIIEVKNLKCRPCSKIGFNSCPKKHFKCMNLMDNKAIIQHIQAFWNT